MRSGDEVATTSVSISSGATCAASSAFRAAIVAISEVGTAGSATWRCRMPVRSTIHASSVSTSFSSSALVTIRGGAWEPVPRIFTLIPLPWTS